MNLNLAKGRAGAAAAASAASGAALHERAHRDRGQKLAGSVVLSNAVRPRGAGLGLL